MNAQRLIRKKRDGYALSEEEIRWLIEGYTSGTVPDYQMAAWLMAVFFQGLNPQETSALTKAMTDSGEQVDLRAIPGVKVDKHSTGGVGDTTSLVLIPLVAAGGVPVVKMSGRALGHTGGTIDKLEAIPGFRVGYDPKDLPHLVRKTGAAIVGRSESLVPADRLIYELRDVTATVESIPLLASSIMSKKLAAGADRLVLDVKTGRGAFLPEPAQARRLAKALVDIGNGAGKAVRAILTAHDEPLGRAIGNALEVREAIEVLQGRGPADLIELVLALAAEMFNIAGAVPTIDAGREWAKQLITKGAALEKFVAIVRAQGGDPQTIEQPEQLPKAAYQYIVRAPRTGWVGAIDPRQVAAVCHTLGAGRYRKGDAIDLAVGVVLQKKVGEWAETGEPLAEIHASRSGDEQIRDRLLNAFSIEEERPPVTPIVLERFIGAETKHKN